MDLPQVHVFQAFVSSIRPYGALPADTHQPPQLDAHTSLACPPKSTPTPTCTPHPTSQALTFMRLTPWAASLLLMRAS